MIPYKEIPEIGREDSPHAVEVIFTHPDSDIKDLHTLKGRMDDGQAYIISFWKFNESELDYILHHDSEPSKLIFELLIMGERMPPVVVNLSGLE